MPRADNGERDRDASSAAAAENAKQQGAIQTGITKAPMIIVASRNGNNEEIHILNGPKATIRHLEHRPQDR